MLRFHFICSLFIFQVPWHQDYRTKGEQGRHCSLWIALDNIKEDSGGLVCLPRRHCEGSLPTMDSGHLDFTSVLSCDGGGGGGAQRSLLMDAGQACMLDPLLPHASFVNKTKEWRRALLLRFAESGQHVQNYSSSSSSSITSSSLSRCHNNDNELPLVYKDGSWFADYRTGEVFEGVSLLLSHADYAYHK